MKDSTNSERLRLALERAYVQMAYESDDVARSCRAIVIKHWREILKHLDKGGTAVGLTTRFKDSIRAATAEIVNFLGREFDRTARSSFAATDRAMFLSISQEQAELVEAEDLLARTDDWPADRKILPLPPDPGPARKVKYTQEKKLTPTVATKIIKSGKYKERMEKWSKQITNKKEVADIIAKGVAKGESLEQIAKKLEPHVRNLSSSAMRIARTEAARIHNEVAEKSFENYAELIVGYRVINPLDEVTRPHHRKRATEENANGLRGRIYWKEGHKPKGAKYSAASRPSLPDEPNCRCGYAPVLQEGMDVKKATVKEPGKMKPTVKDIEHDVDEKTLRRFRDAERAGKPKKFRAGIRGATPEQNAKLVGTREWHAKQEKLKVEKQKAEAAERGKQKILSGKKTQQVTTKKGKKIDVPKTRKDGERVVKELPSNTLAARRGLTIGARVQYRQGKNRGSGKILGYVRNLDGSEDVMIFDATRGKIIFVTARLVSTI
jgi:SPP1 gp7 family putative phage head morphogenesis protein